MEAHTQSSKIVQHPAAKLICPIQLFKGCLERMVFYLLLDGLVKNGEGAKLPVKRGHSFYQPNQH